MPVNFRIGWTPGRLLQIASRRLAGQDWASSTNSCGLLKLSKGVVVVVAASSGVACAMMWLSVSIVKVVIMVFLCSARCAVNTWITPQGWKRKAILNQIDDGERTAMVGANAVRAATFSAKSEPRGSISAPGNTAVLRAPWAAQGLVSGTHFQFIKVEKADAVFGTHPASAVREDSNEGPFEFFIKISEL